MDRRHFCRLAGLSLLGLSLRPADAVAAMAGSGVRRNLAGRCTIEVIRCECFADLQSRYLDDPEAGRCGRFHVGDKLVVSADNIDDFCAGKVLCRGAWTAVEPYVSAALSGEPMCGCNPAASEREAVVCCPDGTRPVVFKITVG